MLCSNRVFLPIRRAASWLDSVESRYTHILFINEDTTGGVELVVFPDTSADRWWRPEVMLTLSLSDECPSPWATV